MSIQIIRVQSKKDKRLFIDFPYKLYEFDRTWVPPLKIAIEGLFKKNHPFYESGEMERFLAVKRGQVIGRIAAIINHSHNNFHNENIGFFGFFECVHDHEVAAALFKEAEKFFKRNNIFSYRGPVNPSTNYECALLVDGFKDPPQIMMTYNKEYYHSLIEGYGFKKAKDLFAYRLDPATNMPDIIKRAFERGMKSHKVSFRTLNKKKWDDEVTHMLDIYNDAWERNWGFIPLSEKEFRHMAADLKTICNPDLIVFAQVAGSPAGFIVGLPDYNQVFKQIPGGKLFPFGFLKLFRANKYIKRGRCVTLGVKSKYRSTGVGGLLIKALQNQIIKHTSYHEFEQSWVLEDNRPMNKPLELMGAQKYKTYRIYDKEINQ